MATTITIDPVTRIEGHLKVSISVDTVNGVQQIVDAWVGGTLFRGFERILLQRHPWDAQHVCQRICGVCPVSQGTAALLAMEQAGNVQPPPNGILLRNLIGAANFVDSHILSFYHLAIPDFINGPAMPPFQPAWTADKGTNKRADKTTTDALVKSYLAAMDIRRKAQSLGAIFGGRMPHPSALIPGGITTSVRPDRIKNFKQLLAEIQTFIDSVYLPDVDKLGKIFADYFDIGKGHGHLLAYGAFGSVDNDFSDAPLTPGFKKADSNTVALNTRAIAEHVTYSWYDDATQNLKPTDGETTAKYPKDNAYSWLKAPRYDGRPCEVGPLARMMITGDYTRGISVMDRHSARAQEAKKLTNSMVDWLAALDAAAPNYTESAVPVSGRGEGLTEAPRGALGHWVAVENTKISRYQVVTPTCWNASPRDVSGLRGPMEEALIGAPISDMTQPVEALRVIHSFDPCTACAVHVMRPERSEAVAVLYDAGINR